MAAEDGVQWWDLPSGHPAFSPSSETLAVADWDGEEVVVYDVATGRVERRLPAQQCWAAEFSPDGNGGG